MLIANKLQILLDLVQSSTKEELIWMNGYLSGLVANGEIKEKEIIATTGVNKITIAYGTETGNSKKLALDFASKAKKKGINAKLVSLDQYRVNDLAKEEYFLTIVSTHGDGEPPAAAKKFYDHIHLNGFKVDKLKYGVLALGDTAYPLFCKTGEDIDQQLNKLGGQRIVSLQKCDTDYETEAGNWFTEVLQALSNKTASQPSTVTRVEKTTTRKQYTGTVITNINLNDRGSNKRTHHLEFETEDADYLPGDSIGIVPENPLSVVEAIIEHIGIDRYRSYTYRNESSTLFDLLKKKLNIVFLPERSVKQYASIVQQDIPSTKIGLLDLLKIYPVNSEEQFEKVLQMLDPITPRLYSIASSKEAHGDDIHLTVARDTFIVNEEQKFGLCSECLTSIPVDSKINFYIHRNNQFRLPAADKDVIMIGSGTGIAPFRSFLAERDATGATGRNWLFFGDQHFISDFLYQVELQNWLETGVLTKLSVAFSRDQDEKVYVQHKMAKQADELWQWIQSGAYVYVCGAKSMSEDVESTLLKIIEVNGNKSAEEVQVYFDQLKDEGRWLKDVY